VKRLEKTPVEIPSFDQVVDYFNSIVARVASFEAVKLLGRWQRGHPSEAWE
jgi:hypothetical protein